MVSRSMSRRDQRYARSSSLVVRCTKRSPCSWTSISIDCVLSVCNHNASFNITQATKRYKAITRRCGPHLREAPKADVLGHVEAGAEERVAHCDLEVLRAALHLLEAKANRRTWSLSKFAATSRWTFARSCSHSLRSRLFSR